MAEFGCMFYDDAEVSGLRLQYEVVSLVFFNSKERVVMALYRHHSVMQAGWNVVQCSSSTCFIVRERSMFLRTPVL